MKESKKDNELENLIEGGIDSIIKTKRKEYFPFRLVEKIKDFLKINPSTAEGWFQKGLKLKLMGRFHNDTYCFEKSILLNHYNAFAWFELADNGKIFFNKNSDLYYKIARAINPDIDKIREETLLNNNQEYLQENRKIHAVIDRSGVKK
ncbi:hypothetical protein HYV86_07685 [Candidatus Woesearchaeota archaeon]|nr:hypothetical protein [Candidatus Woesearchaeota archaeon]